VSSSPVADMDASDSSSTVASGQVRRRGRLIVVAAVLAAALAVAAGVFVIRHDWLVEDLMERVHEGKDSPWAVARTQADADPPDWGSLGEGVGAFAEMAEALKGAKHADVRASADGYADAATDLADAVRQKDAEGLRRAVAVLGKSCADCHFDGGVGGAQPLSPAPSF